MDLIDYLKARKKCFVNELKQVQTIQNFELKFDYLSVAFINPEKGFTINFVKKYGKYSEDGKKCYGILAETNGDILRYIDIYVGHCSDIKFKIENIFQCYKNFGKFYMSIKFIRYARKYYKRILNDKNGGVTFDDRYE